MTPIPTPIAKALFFLGVLVVTGAVAIRSVGFVTLGASLLAFLAFVLLLTRPLARRARRERLEFAWWLAHDHESAALGAVTPGAPFTIRCFVRNRSTHSVRITGVHPLLTDAAPLDAAPDLEIPARTRIEFALRIVAPAAGRVVLHGLAIQVRGALGLFTMPLYFPTHLVVKVLPSVAARSRANSAPRTGAPVDRTSSRAKRHRGDGTELRELRELQPGDAFKRIAWRPSARRGRLLVRETESELQETRHLILDVSGTMRGGAPGKRKLDDAIDLVARSAKASLEDGHRVALQCIDARLVASANAGEGPRHLLRIYDALLACTEIVDVDLTEIGSEDLASLVASYVRRQEGIDFRRADGTLDITQLAEHARRVLGRHVLRAPVLAENHEHGTLRRYCLAHGIRLPYRPEPREGGKTQAMLAALREAGASTRTPRSIELVSDFDGVHDFTEVARTVRFLRKRGHYVAVVLVDARSRSPRRGVPLDDELRLIYGRAEDQHLSDAERAFRSAGAAVSRIRGASAAMSTPSHFPKAA
jgi:uncharacterized protein (DUF58 family)